MKKTRSRKVTTSCCSFQKCLERNLYIGATVWDAKDRIMFGAVIVSWAAWWDRCVADRFLVLVL